MQRLKLDELVRMNVHTKVILNEILKEIDFLVLYDLRNNGDLLGWMFKLPPVDFILNETHKGIDLLIL